MKRLKAMSNREWMQKHEPESISKSSYGGVIGCPETYDLENYQNCDPCTIGGKECANCWNLPAKRNGKYIMKVVKEL